MRRLLLLIVRYRAFFVFLGLELICFVLIVKFNSFQSAAYFNTSNKVAGASHALTSGVAEYFALKEGNARLAEQNALLLKELDVLRDKEAESQMLQKQNLLLQQKLQFLTSGDSSKLKPMPFSTSSDSAHYAGFDFIPAKVIKNDVLKESNYITINKGNQHGVFPGMGVLGPNGVVGKVVTASSNYATIKSVLHVDNMTSVELKRNQVLGTLKWEGEEINQGTLNFIPRHIPVGEGDTVVTSGFNAVFPRGMLVGTVASLNLTDASFYKIGVDLSSDFSRLYYVYVLKNQEKEELDLLEKETEATENE